MAQVETIWNFINHSNCEVTRNRSFQSGRFGHGSFQIGCFNLVTFLYINNFTFL